MPRLFFCVALLLSFVALSISPVLARTDAPTVSAFSATSTGAVSSRLVKTGRFDPANPPPSQPTADSRIAPARLTVSVAELKKRRAEEAAAMPRLDSGLAPATKTRSIANLTSGTSVAGQTVSLLASAEGID